MSLRLLDYTQHVPLSRLLGCEYDLRIVDVGVGAGVGAGDPPPYGLLLATGSASVVGFEPDAAALAALNAGKGARESYLGAMVGDGGRHRFHRCAQPAMDSLLAPNPVVAAAFDGLANDALVVATEEVDTVRLDEVPETEGADFLRIDVNGAEMMVLENAAARLRDVLVVHVRVAFLETYVGRPQFSEVDAFLRAHGFAFHKFEPAVNRDATPVPADLLGRFDQNQLFWANAVFIRDIAKPDRLADGQLLKLVALLYDVYRSIDLCLHLLKHYDARTGADYNQKLFAALTSA